jgi:hypothetical protein
MEPSREVTSTGAVALETAPHPEDLIRSSGYNGFQAVADSAIKQTDPGKEWDQVLTEYVQGKRSQPVWGYGGSSLQCDESGEVNLGGVRTVFLVREKSRESIFDALKNGKMYSVRQSGDHRLFLDKFVAKDKTSGQQATMGEPLEASDAPSIAIQVHSSGHSAKTAEISLIRNGLLVRQERVSLPYQSTWKDAKVNRQGRVYYRLRVTSGAEDYLLSNPIFVKFSESTAKKFRLPPSSETLAPKTPRVNAPKAPDLKDQRNTSKTLLDLPKIAQTESPKAPALKPSPPAKKPKAVQKTPTVKKPAPPSTQEIARAGEKPTITVKVKHGFLRKGPGIVFPKAGDLKQGDKLSLVRRTEIFYQEQRWLVVRADGKLAYVWAGIVDTD